MIMNNLSQDMVNPSISIGDFKKNPRFPFIDVSQSNKKES
jgi:hypothetical protein